MTDWSALQHAYGPAGDVPGLLAAATAGGPEAARAWEDLWGCLCHQGTVYSASYPAIPYLAEAALRTDPAPYSNALHLAATIMGSDDTPGPDDASRARRRHARELADLEQRALQTLALSQLHDDPTSFIYLLQAVLAFRDVPHWKNRLEGLANEEYELDCPHCHEYLRATLTATQHYLTHEPDGPVSRSTPLTPADSDTLDDPAAWLHRTSLDHDQTGVAHQIRHLFGQATCPACGTRFPLPDAVIAGPDAD